MWSELTEIPQCFGPKEGNRKIKYKFGYESDYFSFHPAINMPVMGRNKSLIILQMLIKIIDWNEVLKRRNVCGIQLCSHLDVAVAFFSLAAQISFAMNF